MRRIVIDYLDSQFTTKPMRILELDHDSSKAGDSLWRFWRRALAAFAIWFPKQFLCLTGKESLFQDAAKRLTSLSGDGVEVCAPLIVTNEEHRFLAIEQLRESGLEAGAALLEPMARNTAPAAALAAVENGDGPVLVVTPADQTVADAGVFNGAMHDAIR